MLKYYVLNISSVTHFKIYIATIHVFKVIPPKAVFLTKIACRARPVRKLLSIFYTTGDRLNKADKKTICKKYYITQYNQYTCSMHPFYYILWVCCTW